MPDMKRQLHGAQLALRGWHRLKPPTPHPPLNWNLAVLIAVTMAYRTGKETFAIAVLVAFDSYLRISEFTEIRKEDVADSNGRF